MALLLRGIEPENIQGEWCQFVEGIEFKIRPLTPKKAEEIERRISGAETKIRMNEESGDREIAWQSDKIAATVQAKAFYALIDSRGAEITIDDDAARGFFSRVAKREVSLGDSISLDGIIASDEVKAWVLERLGNTGVYGGAGTESDPSVSADVWIMRKAQELGRGWAKRSASLKSEPDRVGGLPA